MIRSAISLTSPNHWVLNSGLDKISETISNYKILKHDEKRRLRLEKIENERKEKLALEKLKKEEETIKVKLKEKALKEETRLEKQRIGKKTRKV